MIELIGEPLPIDTEMKFRKWLRMPEANTLLRIVGAKCQLAQSTALNRVLTATEGDPSDIMAQAEIRESAQMAYCSKLIQELSEQPKDQRFLTYKLKPHTSHATVTEPAGEAEA